MYAYNSGKQSLSTAKQIIKQSLLSGDPTKCNKQGSHLWFNKTIIVQTKQSTQAFKTVFFKQYTQLTNKFKTVLLLKQSDNIPQTQNNCLARTINSIQWKLTYSQLALKFSQNVYKHVR